MGERGQRKRFARAVDDESGRTDDEEFRAELAVISQLRQADTESAVDQQTRQHVAARMARKTAEWETPAGTTTEPPAASARPTSSARSARRPRRRPLLAATLSVTAGIVTLAVLWSSDALPGDVLYTVKRARESAVLAVTLDDRAAALQRLDYAADRVTELEQLAARTDRQGEMPAAYRSGLTDFDSAARSAAATLTTVGTNSGGGSVDELRDWSARQSRRLNELRPSLARPQARRQESSAQLLERIEQRTTALHERFDCYRITTGGRDGLGPLPASGRCVTTGRWDGSRTKGDDNDTATGGSDTTRGRKPAPPSDSYNERARQRHDHERQGSTNETRGHTTDSPDAPRPPSPTSQRNPELFRPTDPAPPPAGRPHQPADTSDEQPGRGSSNLVDTLHGLVSDVFPERSPSSDPDTASSPTPAAR